MMRLAAIVPHAATFWDDGPAGIIVPYQAINSNPGATEQAYRKKAESYGKKRLREPEEIHE